MIEYLYEFGSVVFVLMSTIYLSLEALFRLIVKPSKKQLMAQKVLVTGAAKGLGQALAMELSSRGAILILWDVDQDEIHRTAEKIRNNGGEATAYVCDVSLRDDVIKTSEQVLEDHGFIDVLVNNAGIMLDAKPFLSHKHQNIKRTIDVNLMGHFWTIEAFLPSMLSRHKGHIVAISSLAGREGVPNVVPYCASKFGVHGLMEALREELRQSSHKDIYTTCVYPGAMNTPMLRSFETNIRRNWVFPITEPEEAAKQILDGIQRNYVTVYIPPFTEFGDILFKIFPRRVNEAIKDFLGAEVKEKHSIE